MRLALHLKREYQLPNESTANAVAHKSCYIGERNNNYSLLEKPTNVRLHTETQNNLFHHSPVALFGLEAAESANKLTLVKLIFLKVDQI